MLIKAPISPIACWQGCHLPPQSHQSSFNHLPSQGCGSTIVHHRVYCTCFVFAYSSILGDMRLWVGPRSRHLLSTWDLTNPESIIGRDGAALKVFTSPNVISPLKVNTSPKVISKSHSSSQSHLPSQGWGCTRREAPTRGHISPNVLSYEGKNEVSLEHLLLSWYPSQRGPTCPCGCDE